MPTILKRLKSRNEAHTHYWPWSQPSRQLYFEPLVANATFESVHKPHVSDTRIRCRICAKLCRAKGEKERKNGRVMWWVKIFGVYHARVMVSWLP
jgi:hypothetical protein